MKLLFATLLLLAATCASAQDCFEAMTAATKHDKLAALNYMQLSELDSQVSHCESTIVDADPAMANDLTLTETRVLRDMSLMIGTMKHERLLAFVERHHLLEQFRQEEQAGVK